MNKAARSGCSGIDRSRTVVSLRTWSSSSPLVALTFRASIATFIASCLAWKLGDSSTGNGMLQTGPLSGCCFVLSYSFRARVCRSLSRVCASMAHLSQHESPCAWNGKSQPSPKNMCLRLLENEPHKVFGISRLGGGGCRGGERWQDCRQC